MLQIGNIKKFKNFQMKVLLSFITIIAPQPIYSHQISPMMSMSLEKCSKHIRQ